MEDLTFKEKLIIKAAIQIFLEKGKDGARMKEIARQAGVNKAALHYYFRSKENLYEIVVSSELRRFFTDFFASLNTDNNFESFLRLFINNYVDRAAKSPQVIRFIAWEIEYNPQLISETMGKLFKELGYNSFPFLEKIQYAIENGEIRPLQPVHFILSLISMCLYPFLAEPIISKVFTEADFRTELFLSERKEAIFNLVWGGIKPLIISTI